MGDKSVTLAVGYICATGFMLTYRGGADVVERAHCGACAAWISLCFVGLAIVLGWLASRLHIALVKEWS